MRDLILKFQRGDIPLDQFKQQFNQSWGKASKQNADEDVVMYSYKMNQHPHVNEHERKRLNHSISSLREFNPNIKVFLFCDRPEYVLDFKDKYNIEVLPFAIDYDPNLLNAWSIHRWFNLDYFHDDDYNILYIDSDTIFYGDVQYLFNTYSTYDVYGKEERGFRHCPITGSSRDIRFNLDLVDACIRAEGSPSPVYKYCIGVLLFNNFIHRKINNRRNQLIKILEDLKENKMLNPIPNPRILDQYAIWIILSRAQARCGLFGVQDVTHSYLETKHKEYFNPILLHYTTRDEQEFAMSDDKYNDLVRNIDELGIQIDPHSMV